MKIAWNKVTWYSKVIALVLFVAFPFIGFCLGMQYGETIAQLYRGSSAIGTMQPTSTASDYYSNPAEWQTDTRSDGGFSIAYPIDFSADDNYSKSPSTDWRLDANGAPGIIMLTIMIPSAFEPQTNFADAKLTVGMSQNDIAVTNCLSSGASGIPNSATSTVMINGIAFVVFQSGGAGAGNYYQTTSYRTLHAGACYAVEYTIHSGQIANYPSQYNLKPFDQNQVMNVLNRMVGTFRFQ
jgi:hypothetical protein